MDLLTNPDPTGGTGSEAPEEPFALFEQWFDAARSSEPADPNAMALATAGRDGLPNVRIVLFKEFNPRGLVFYTNAESCKGVELAANMRAAAVLHWKSLGRQVRVRGPVELVSAAEADAYFASRPRLSRIGARASRQSRPLADRRELEQAVAREIDLHLDSDVPRPLHWNGYRIKPGTVEFWTDRPFRLHDRLLFVREPDGRWHRRWLYP